MSNRKIIRLLLWGILLLAGIHVFLSFRGMGNVLLPRKTLMDEPGRDQPIERIVIARRGEPATVIESAAALAASNGVVSATTEGWCITSPYWSLAENRLVRRLQDALMLSPISSAYREQDLLDFGRTRADYGLETPELQVTLMTGGRELSFGFGQTTPTGDGVFVSIEGDSAIYVVETNVLAAVGLPADGFRLRNLCPEGVASVDGFLIKRGTESLTSFRLRDGVWSKLRLGEEDAVEPASAVNVRELLRRLDQTRAVDFVWPVGATNESEIATAQLLAPYGLDAESAVTVTLQRPSKSERDQIAFGKPAKDGLVYALIQDSRAIVTLDGRLSDFIRSTDFADVRLFPFEPAAVSRISIVDEGVACRLTRAAEGGWLLDEPVSAPAETRRVETLVENLLSLTVTNRVERGVAVSIQTNGPVETVSHEALLGDFSLADLRSREILDLAAGEVRRLTQTGEGKPTAVVYDKDMSSWNVETSGVSGTVSKSAVEGVLETLHPLKAEKVVLLKASAGDLRRYGLEDPRFKIAVDPAQEGNLRRVILIGKSAQGGSFATLVGAAESIFILSDETVRRLTASLVTE